MTAKDARGPRALLLALAGRAALERPRRASPGTCCPSREAWVRAHVGVALLDGSATRSRDLRRALAGGPGIVVIDGARRLDPGRGSRPGRRVAAGCRIATPELTLVVASTRPDAARALLAEAGWPDAPVLDIAAAEPAPFAADRARLHPTSAPTTEVHALVLSDPEGAEA